MSHDIDRIKQDIREATAEIEKGRMDDMQKLKESLAGYERGKRDRLVYLVFPILIGMLVVLANVVLVGGIK